VNTPECVVLVGLPGAGKTTFARAQFPSHVHVSKDAFPPHARDKQARQDAAIRAALVSGQSVVVDNTNVTLGDRAGIIAIARECGARVLGYYIEATPRQAVARNAGRTGHAKVPNVAIFTCAKKLVAPAEAEGFDELHHVTTDR
jgi:predicted kinase